jgi:hypothetical protein
MSILTPNATTVNDLCLAALKTSGYIGVGNTALADDLNDAWAWLQWMLQQWERKSFLVYHMVTYTVTSTGQLTPYTVGPGGQISVGTSGLVARPDAIESAFLRQLTTTPQIDYPLEILQSMMDYNTISLKTLVSFPGIAFYDAAWPLGQLYAWPIPQAATYALGITVKEQLPSSFASSATVINLPFEYYMAIVANLGLRLRAKYHIPTFPGDPLPGMARDGLAVLRGVNSKIARLRIPADLQRSGLYNIFNDRLY